MKWMGMTAGATLDKLTEGLTLDGQACRRVGEQGGCFMQVCVERVGSDTYSVAHYGEQNGDLMRDPEMVFYAMPDGQGGHRWFPIYFRNDYVGVEQFAASRTEDGWRCYEKLQRSLVSFATTWMRNIKSQQADYFKKTKRAA